MNEKALAEAINEFTKTIAALRHPQTGCPWDLEQTKETLLPYFIEEVYEYVDSVEQGQVNEQMEELGDVLLQIVLHCQLATEKNQFSLIEVCGKINEKIITRHPHVFAPEKGSITKEEVKENWKKFKSKEGKQVFPQSLISNPALFSSYKIGKRAAQVDFDWDNPEEVWQKVEEEFAELKSAIKNQDKLNTKEELGDLFFTLSQYSRHIEENPEDLARQANRKFLKRIHQVQKICEQQNKTFEQLSREEKEQAWKQVKIHEKN